MKIADRIIKSRQGIELLRRLPPIHSLIIPNYTQDTDVHLVLFPKIERPLNSEMNDVSFIKRIVKDGFSPSKIIPCISLIGTNSKNLDQEMGFYRDNGIECVMVTENGLNDSRDSGQLITSGKYKDLATLTEGVKKISPDMRVI
ncbi:MAG: hypothetical protein ISQ34_05410 [Rickettsiales bacterium]|nr:hypothetical protein [Rickettsiales bacterium]